MHIRQACGRKALLLLITVCVVLAGCSRMNLAYRNLHLLIPWSLNDYLDMNRDQQQRLRAQLRDHLSWHCRTQLPAYLKAIERLQNQVGQGDINEARLRAHYQSAKQAIQTIAVEITPTTTQMLRDLDDEQISELSEAFAKDRREREKKYLQPPLEQQIRERAQRMTERVEQWLGSVNAVQRQRILAWAHTLGDQNRFWLANRAQWQQALSEALAKRHEEGFDNRIAKLLQDRESFWTTDYRDAFARTEQAAFHLVNDLYALSDTDQRRHLEAQLGDLHKDLSSLDCLSESR
ncbi:DUF6279 family lipoprotein [Pseudomonas sp. KSR10]|uniref:DUF6279 family lipoprotein n=1 Tax=Pseudomonas sp. KSR10 TaxID=2916654 RepID=UPI001EF92E41|nr:DUF6279 family lipoprotein [Pseudomonas sp. KSR10]MCG6540359.1 DUF6279 family lipoprotein [Pseudomonas sp. KSR10]